MTIPSEPKWIPHIRVIELAEIATLPAASPNEEIKINVIQLQSGVIYVDARLWRNDKPTHHGIRLSLQIIREAVAALNKAHTVGREIVERGKE